MEIRTVTLSALVKFFIILDLPELRSYGLIFTAKYYQQREDLKTERSYHNLAVNKSNAR